MATLQRIRNRAGLLVAIIIGLALVAFILGDMLRSGSSLLRPQQLEVAEINGESVQYPDFQKRIEEMAEIYKMNTGATQLDDETWVQVREQAWQNLVREIVMSEVYEDLGLTVTSDELFDMVQGANLHPIIQQLFRNPQTGQVDKTAVLQFLKSLETNATAQQRAYWLYIEDQIKEERIQTKYNNLVAKGLNATTVEAKNSLEAKNQSVNAQYIRLPFSYLPDSAVSVTESELKDYYNKHKDDYKQEESRTIEYVTFNVKASEADDANTLKWMEDVKPEFANVADNAQYVNVNSDVRFENIYQKESELPVNLAEFAFNGEEGDIYGPYKEGNTYKLVKIDEFKDLPDSVEARHILIKPETVGSYEAAMALADSLKSEIEDGASFAKLAEEYSEDAGSARKGGDLGWFKKGQMVKPFEEAAFNGEVNELYTTTSQFGVHLIQPTKKGKEVKQVRLATLIRNVEPSTQTYQTEYAKASKFVAENQDYDSFNEAIANEKRTKKIATFGENDREVRGLEQSRSLIRAAYDADVEDILHNAEGSAIFELGDNFVIAAVASATEEGIASFEEVKPRIELAVKKQNKGQAIAKKMTEAVDGKDFEAAASALNTEVKDANGITFNSTSIPSIGLEPAVIGTMTTLSQDETSSPVVGNSGVYLVKVISKTEGSDENVQAEQQRLNQALSYRAAYQAYEAQKNAVEIEDKRAKFY
ncbi:peptidylprolyl isomerase [Sunxiuqinia indica]|uniref:peptidylprolyl isomerase n=1 Tax=Sunxiuqinia indica TaxID=2692584 RepID=UPI00135C106A|nr:SurA N-terminal domain-containing protein [Sunxiuqinia indica]